MVFIFLWIGVGLLVVSNALSLAYLYRQYKERSEVERYIHIYVENIKILEKEVFDLNKENSKVHNLNIELAKNNRVLKTKLDRINSQIKQVSEHFKTN